MQSVSDQVSSRVTGTAARRLHLYSKSGDDAITSRTYKEAGVDIDAGNALVEAIKPLAAATARPGSAAGLGGFGALFDLKEAGYHDPILVATTDGVGTKLKLAVAAGRHEGIGLDLVAMCVNDLLVQGAEPLFFLDYYACGRLDVQTGRTIVDGIARGCREAGCALVGGETAEMPGLYDEDDYDLAGFAVGAVERSRVLTAEAVAAGDIVLGLASSGLHANGFSLVGRLVSDLRLDLAAPAPFRPEAILAEALLTPTRIYARALLAVLAERRIKALAHITGGGLVENLPRVLPSGLAARLDAAAWPLPPAFAWLAREGGVAHDELARTFNCGIGMALVTAAAQAEGLARRLETLGETAFIIGRIEPHDGEGPRLRIDNREAAWPS